MKRTNEIQPAPVFVPFTLTIETLDEARLLAALLGNCPCTIAKHMNIDPDPAYSMYKLLKDFNSPQYDIEITVK